VETELDIKKVTVQSRGRTFLGPAVAGYEIHMGITDHLKSINPFLVKEDGQKDGAVLGRLAGTYFHGLFENENFTEKFLTVVAESRRIEWRPGPVRYSKEAEYDRLAAVAREHLDIERILGMMSRG